jgi:hypothetical protein
MSVYKRGKALSASCLVCSVEDDGDRVEKETATNRFATPPLPLDLESNETRSRLRNQLDVAKSCRKVAAALQLDADELRERSFEDDGKFLLLHAKEGKTAERKHQYGL